MNKEFIGNKLRLARLVNMLTQAELAEAVGVTRQYIHSLEIGHKSPSRKLLAALSLPLNVTPDFFSDPLVNEVREEQCHFRSRKTTSLSSRQQFIARGTIFSLVIKHLDSRLELPRVNLPRIEIKNEALEIENAAEECRKHWGLDEGPITNMCRVLENKAGVIVTYFEGVSEKVDALSVSMPRPIVVRNPAKGATPRFRFDLGHELAHLVMHFDLETGDDVTEWQANRFASALLMPRKTFAADFPRTAPLDWASLYRMKTTWGTSVAAIAYRARDLNLIDATQFYSVYTYLSRTGQRKHEKYDELVPDERPELLGVALEAYENGLGLSIADIGTDLGVTPMLLWKLLAPHYSHGGTDTDTNEPDVIQLKRYRDKKTPMH